MKDKCNQGEKQVENTAGFASTDFVIKKPFTINREELKMYMY